MAQQRRSTLAICRSGTFAVQGAFLTALSQAAIDTRIPLDDTDPKIDLIVNKERILNCTGQQLMDKILQSRMQRLTYGIKAIPAELFGHCGWGMGVVAGDTVSMLPDTVFQPPPTSLIVGHKGSGVQPFIMKSMVLMKINISANATSGYTITFEWLGHGAPVAAVAYTFPDCDNVAAARFKDGSLLINSVERKAESSGYDFTFDNKPDPNDPFTIAGPDITRNERADEVERILKAKLFGEYGDADYVAGVADPMTQYPWTFRIGSLTDGISFSAADSGFELDSGGEGYTGGFKRSELPYILEPLAPTSTSPIIVTRET